MLVPTILTRTTPAPFLIPTWQDGTDAEIIEALNRHYAGEIDIKEYWSVGDKRTYKIPFEIEYQQVTYNFKYDLTFVLTNAGGKMLANVTPDEDEVECAFQVDIEDAYYTGDEDYSKPRMNSTKSNVGGWRDSDIREYCNGEFIERYIPESIREIFKVFKNQSGIGNGHTSALVETNDRFALRSATELGFDKIPDRDSYLVVAPVEGQVANYYQSSVNRFKYVTTFEWNDSTQKLDNLHKQGVGNVWTRTAFPYALDYTVGYGQVKVNPDEDFVYHYIQYSSNGGSTQYLSFSGANSYNYVFPYGVI